MYLVSIDDMSIFQIVTHLPMNVVLISTVMLVFSVFCIIRPSSLMQWYTQVSALIYYCWEHIVGHRLNEQNDIDISDMHQNLRSSNVITMQACEATQSEIENTIASLGEFRFTERKQCGRTFKDVFETDKNYVKWILAHETTQHNLSFGYRLFAIYVHLRSVTL